MFSPTSSRIIALLAGFALMASTMMGELKIIYTY
jgi:hypothetical protein